MDHIVTIEKVDIRLAAGMVEQGFRPRCSCGWKGVDTLSALGATADGGAHKRRMRREERETYAVGAALERAEERKRRQQEQREYEALAELEADRDREPA